MQFLIAERLLPAGTNPVLYRMLQSGITPSKNAGITRLQETMWLAILTWKPRIGSPAIWYHRNIRIEDNVFKIYDYPVLTARSTEALIFKKQ